MILYADIIAGPNTGGEGGNGIYLSLFGKNFGSSPSVTVGGGTVARIVYQGPSNGRPDVEQLSVQIGPNARTGAILVTSGGIPSNADHSFTVSPGTIYFVDNSPSVVASDSLSNACTSIASPCAHVQTNAGPDASTRVHPGDFIVVRGYAGIPYAASGCQSTKSCFWGISYNGMPVGTSLTSAITLLGYPGEFPYANVGASASQNGGIFPWNQSAANAAPYINVAGLKLEAGGSQGAIDVTTSGSYWRIVNNELTMTTAGASTNEGAITGDSPGQFWVGNHVHDTAGSASNQTHGIYVDGWGSYEIAYNWIENINNGSGIQIYDDNGPSTPYVAISNVHIHHNIVHDTLKYGIVLANFGATQGAMTNIAVWDNLVFNTQLPGLCFNYLSGATLSGALIFNNTFFNTCTGASCTSGAYGTLNNDNGSVLSSAAVTLVNNIIAPPSGVPYLSENASGLTSVTATNNLFLGGTGATLGSNAITSGALHFVAPPPATLASGTRTTVLPDMHLAVGSAGIGNGSTQALAGNGLAAVDFVSAFGGLTDDLDFAPVSATSVNVGATQ